MDKHLSDKLISAYLDDLTSRDEAEFVRRHAAECGQCADRLAQFNLLEETVAEMDPQAIQAEDTVLQQVRDRVLRRVSHEQRAPREAPFGWWLNVFSVKSLAYAGIGVLLAGFAVFYIDYPSDAVRRNASGKGEIAKTESVEKGASHPLLRSNWNSIGRRAVFCPAWRRRLTAPHRRKPRAGNRSHRVCWAVSWLH